ncbi:acylphosphatase [Bifidobacterium leontopitheci]
MVNHATARATGEDDAARGSSASAPASTSVSADIRVHILVTGLVQGVGFRYFTVMKAGGLKLAGWVRNQYDGSVEVEAQGPRARVAQLISALKQGPRYAQVEQVDVTEIPTQEVKPARHGFPTFGVFYER